MKLRFTNKEQIERYNFEDIEYQIQTGCDYTPFITDNNGVACSLEDLYHESLEFKVYG